MTNPFNEEPVEDFIEEFVESDNKSPRRMSLTFSTKKDNKQYMTKIYCCQEEEKAYYRKYKAAKYLMENFKDVHKWFTDKRVEEHNLMHLVDFAYNPDIDTYYVTYEKKEGSLLDLINNGTEFNENEIRRVVNHLLKALTYLYGDNEEERLIHTFVAPEHILYETAKDKKRKYFLGGLEYCLSPEALLEEDCETLIDNLKYHQKYHPCNFHKFEEGVNDKTYPIVLGMICHTLYIKDTPLEYKELYSREMEDEEYKSASVEFKSFMQHCYKKDFNKYYSVWGLADVYKSAFVKGDKKAIPNYLWFPLRFRELNERSIYEAQTTTVKICRDEWTGKICVMKITREPKSYRFSIENEHNVLTKLKKDNNGFVHNYISSFIIHERLHLISEYMDGSSLDNFIRDLNEHKPRFLYFAEITLVSWNIAKALKGLLDSGIIHRYIKLGNILISILKSQQSTPYIRDAKLAGFSVSKIVNPNIPNITRVGVRGYRAPEMLFGSEYNEKIDVWSFGALLFDMFTMGNKIKILENPTKENINKAIKLLESDFNVKDLEEYKGNDHMIGLCKEIKKKYIELVKGCLEFNSEARLTIDEALGKVREIIEKLDIEQHKYSFYRNPVREVQMEIEKDKRVERGIVFFRFAGVSEHIAEIYHVENKDKFIIHRELLAANELATSSITHKVEDEKEVTLNRLESLRNLDELFSILLDVAKAIKYVHGRDIVIRGLNYEYIYIIRDKTRTRAKVLMRFDPLRETDTKPDQYTPRLKREDFIAPELRNKKNIYCGTAIEDEKDEAKNLKKADIWSFGKVIEYIFPLKIEDKISICFSYTIGEKPRILLRLEEIKECCLNEIPEDRINSTELVESIEKLYYKHTL